MKFLPHEKINNQTYRQVSLDKLFAKTCFKLPDKNGCVIVPDKGLWVLPPKHFLKNPLLSLTDMNEEKLMV